MTDGTDITRNSKQNRELAQRLGESALRLYTIDEACDVLRVSRWQVYQLMNKRQLGSIKIGRRRLIPLREIQLLVDRLQQQGAMS